MWCPEPVDYAGEKWAEKWVTSGQAGWGKRTIGVRVDSKGERLISATTSVEVERGEKRNRGTGPWRSGGES